VPKVRRTEYAFFYCQDGDALDIPLLLRGRAVLEPVRQILALSILTGETHSISRADLDVLVSMPAKVWVDTAELDRGEASVSALARRGLLVSDEPDALLCELRQRDELLSSSQWNVYAALYHFMTKWRDVDLEKPPDEDPTASGELDPRATEKWIALYGEPPAHFHSIAGDASAVTPLPLVRPEGALYDVLLRRKTTRDFASERAVTHDDFSVLLRYAFGCHGYAELGDELVLLKKTSPSGSGLHPSEVFPLVANVEGIAPGLYHYGVARHVLEPIELLSREEVSEFAYEFTSGQPYARSAHCIFVLSTRFYRNFWKHRRHERAYAVLLMDVAHLSQTFYLVCADLGLGAFVTAAINGANIEEQLGLDGFSEGALAVCGCGIPAEHRSPADPEFLPYIPGETVL
jgi:putative peptide maturation dehydrogenase